MRLPLLLFGGAILVGTGWRLGTWCGNTFVQGLDMWCEKAAIKQMKKTNPNFEK